jgi:hypothetical protein
MLSGLIMKNSFEDLNYDICSLDWRLLDKIQSDNNLNPLIEGVLRALFFTIKSISQFNIFVKRHSIIFLVGTHNQHLSLKKVAEKTQSSHVLGFHNFKASSIDGRLPSSLFYMLGWIVFPVSVCRLLTIKNRYQKFSLTKRLERVVVSGSSVFVWKLLFRIWRPRMVVISNDHNHWTRSAVRAAAQLGVRTAYIPHAYTSDSFPELECTVSFLDSEIQRRLYKPKSTLESAQIRITGAVRYESKIKVTAVIEHTPLEGIIICFNELDSLDFIKAILSQISEQLVDKYQIFVKPHPGDRSRFERIKKLCHNFQLTYVEPNDDIYNYSGKAQVLLGGVTGAHIDALMYGMLPLSLSYWYKEDYYGLIKENAILTVDNLFEIPECYNRSLHDVRSIAHRFNYHFKNYEILPSQRIANYFNDLSEHNI